MRVIDVETILLTARWVGDPYWLEDFERSAALISITADDGTTGLGETAIGYFCPEAVPPLVDYYRELLVERELDPLEPETTIRELYRLSHWWAGTGAGLSVLGGIDMALWDIAGKQAGRPVYELLGGAAHARLPLYASGATASWPAERAVEQAAGYVDLGFRAVKLATGYRDRPDGGWHAIGEAARAAEEHEKFAAMRDALGTEVELALDGHAMQVREPWSCSTSIAIAQAVEPFEPLFYEEPLPYDDVEGYARLRAHTRVPIAGGECLTGVREFAPFLRAGALDYAQPDAAHVGGVGVCRRIAALCEADHVGLAVHTGASVGPGFMASLHVSFASPNARIVECLLAPANVREQLLVEPLSLVDGAVAPPTAPGLGIELAPATVDAFPFRAGAIEYT